MIRSKAMQCNSRVQVRSVGLTPALYSLTHFPNPTVFFNQLCVLTAVFKLIFT